MLVFLSRNLNFLVDLINQKRFAEERREALKVGTNSFSFEQNKLKYSNLSKQTTITTDDRQPLDCNRIGTHQLVNLIAHLVILVIAAIVAILYSIYPTTRDPETLEYTHFVPRYLESINLIIFLNSMRQANMLTRLLAIVIVKNLCILLRSIYMYVEYSNINRHRYTKLNIVQIYFAYAANLRVDTSNWWKFLRNCGKHKCNLETTLAGESGCLMRNFVRHVSKLSKIDRLYHFNQIDFTRCFAAAKLISSDSGRFKRKSSSMLELKLPKGRTSTWFERRMSLNPYDEIYFNHFKKLEHRMDPKHALLLWAVIEYTMFSCSFCLLLIIVAYIMMGFNVFRCAQASSPLHKLFVSQKIILGSIEGIIVSLEMAVNIYGYSLLAYTAIVSYSRSNKVLKMLQRELRYHRILLRNFCRCLDTNNVKLDSDSSSSADDESDLDLSQQSDNETHHHHHHHQIDSRGWPKDLAWYKKGYKMRTLEAIRLDKETKYDNAVRDYNCCINQDRLREFNENIDCLIDLTNVLAKELDDIKDYFTNFLNLNFVFGIIGSSMAIAIIFGSQSSVELIVASVLGLACFVPMLYAMFLGATSERCVSFNIFNDNC